MTIGEELGELLTQRAVAHWDRGHRESYGKAAAVGENVNWNMLRRSCIRSLHAGAARAGKGRR